MDPLNAELPDEAFREAVVIRGAADEDAGVALEYRHLAWMFGQRGRDWSLELQRLVQKDGRAYDEMHVKLADGTQKVVLFDITEFFGKY